MADEKGLKFIYDKVSPRAEEEILLFWKQNRIFEKSLARKRGAKTFVFYEGPPTANGAPGVHHVEARSFKDIVLRYKTMRGFYAPRRAGWDTHGLPVEVEVEKSLGLKSKRDIENYGIAEFNRKCRESVWQYKELWEELTERMGFWIDMQNPYITSESSYIESLWAIIKEFAGKKLLYEDYKVVPWCSRCGTALSSHELAQGYEKVIEKESSVFVKFTARGEPKTYFLVWTTTPWTLPGNVALAVNPNVGYLKIKYIGPLEPKPEAGGSVKIGDYYIISKDIFERESRKAGDNFIFMYRVFRTVEEIDGKDLIGREYEPLYPNDAPYKVVAGDFVSTEEGTGIVHIAPAFGDEDFQISKKHALPILQTTDEFGKMDTPEMPWHGKSFIDANQAIMRDLKKRNLFFEKKEYEHDYPFCWRCKTPLMYFARKVWWVDVNAVREKLLANNEKINWYPSHLKEGRFGGWLKEKKNWAFSRERYWGTPLPVWRCSKCSKDRVAGSLRELDELDLQPGELVVMRHGGTPVNLKKLIYHLDPEADKKITLTREGRDEVLKRVGELRKENIEVIVASPSFRTKETAELLAKELGISKIETMPEFFDILISPRFAGKPEEEFLQKFSRREERFWKKPEDSENWRELRSRVMRGIKKIREKFAGKKVLLVGHGDPLWIMQAALAGLQEKDYQKIYYLKPGEFHKKVRLHNWPYNSEGELDLHKPYVDEIKLKCAECGALAERVPEVVDAWFDSGAMPFAQAHWPFDTKKPNYPADYIVEAVDQTRGWFYNLLAVPTLLGKSAPYKNVISLGHVLDASGKKMSKSLGNIVEPMGLFGKYGADAVRWYFYTVNQPWDDKLFREKDIEGAHRRFLMILWNSFLYWKMYGTKRKSAIRGPKLLINQWLLAKWQEVLVEVTRHLESYDIVSAARKLEHFVVEDVSHWHIRRVREYMKDETTRGAGECSRIFGFVLTELSKVLAPFVPFIAEGIYAGVGGRKASVHLEDWPSSRKPYAISRKLLGAMEKTREVVSKALETRQKAGIKIRQPLPKLQIADKLAMEFLSLIKGEVNVKEIVFGKEFRLDTEITPELKEEGLVREFIRQVQDFRKELKLKPQEKVLLSIEGEKEIEALLERQRALIEREVSLRAFAIREKGEFAKKEISLEGKKVMVGIRREK